MAYGMYEDDVVEILNHNYWPVVDIDGKYFIAKLYKKRIRGKNKGWRKLKERKFKTALGAWDYLKETLMDTLKFVI